MKMLTVFGFNQLLRELRQSNPDFTDADLLQAYADAIGQYNYVAKRASRITPTTPCDPVKGGHRLRTVDRKRVRQVG